MIEILSAEPALGLETLCFSAFPQRVCAQLEQ